MSWEEWGVIVALLGAIGQTVTAVAVVIYTKKSVKTTATKSLIDMVNDWNAFAVSTPDHVKALAEFRAPVVGHPQDSIVFSYINYLHASFVMRAEGLIPAENEQKVIKNGARWLSPLGRERLEQYLKRGYDEPFKKRVLDEFDKIPDKIAGHASSPRSSH